MLRDFIIGLYKARRRGNWTNHCNPN